MAFIRIVELPRIQTRGFDFRREKSSRGEPRRGSKHGAINEWSTCAALGCCRR
ncbi:MAG: hypothetical protein GY782_06695 [Gammaproteobacteria bacterium]|nr:hypothetical protein [Gammaproteobacteria bacterium]